METGLPPESKINFPDEDGKTRKARLFQMSRLWFDSITLDTQLGTLGCFRLIGGNRKRWLFYKERETKGEKGRKGRKKEEGKDAGSEARDKALANTSSEPALS